jgi:hypothetical protein
MSGSELLLKIKKMGKSYFKIILSLSFIFFCNACAVPEKLLMSGSGWDKLVIVDKKTNSVEWAHQLQKGDDCNDVEITKAGNILYAYKGGARLITKSQNIVWDFKVEKGQELYTATEMPTGEYLLAVCAKPSRIITLNAKGEKTGEQNFDTGVANVHGQFRQIMPTKEGNYLIPLMGKGEVIEMTKSGRVLRRVTVGGNPFSVKVMPGGRWVVGCGDAHKYVVVDPATQSVKDSVTSIDITKVSLLFVAEPHPYRNGNLMIANWNGHSKDKTQPALVEINSKKQVVWTLANPDKDTKISAFFSFKGKK